MASPSRRASSPVLAGLVATLGDADEAVRQAASASLVTIGTSHPAHVLPQLIQSLNAPSSVSSASAAASAAAEWLTGCAGAQRIAILRAAADIARQAQRTAGGHALPVESLLGPAIDEVDQASDAELASVAGDLLAELGRAAPHEAAQQLIARCAAGVLPSPGLLRGLGDLAQASPPVMVPQLKSQLLPRLLPLLGAAKGDARIALGIALHHFAQAISAHDTEAANAEGTATSSFSSEMQAAIELLLAGWLPSRSERVRDAAAEAISSMVVLLPAGHMRTLIPRLLPNLVASRSREREWERFPITAALWAALAHAEACNLGREMHSEQLLLPALQTLHTAVCAPLDRSSAACLRNHNEELRCVEAIGGLAFEPTLTFLIHEIDGDRDASTTCGTLEVLRHLVQRRAERLDGRGPALLAAVSSLLPCGPHRVRLAIVQLVGALGTRGFLLSEGGRPLLIFLLRQAALTDEDGSAARARHGAETYGAGETREASTKTLELLASTVPSMRKVLWGLLLTPLLSDDFVHAAPIVCKMMLHIGSYYAQNEPASLQLTVGASGAAPNSHALFARLLMYATTLDWMPALSERALQLLLVLAPQIHHALPRLWSNHVPKLLEYLRSCAPALCGAPGAAFEKGAAIGGGGGDGGDSLVSGGVGSGGGRLGEEWSQLCVHFTGDTLDAIAESSGGPEWVLALGHEMLSQLSSSLLPARLKASILGHLGPLLARTPANALLPHAVPAMLASVKASDSAEADPAEFETGGMRLGCAIGMGGAAASHLDSIVDSLSGTLRTLAGPEPSTVADFFMSQVTSMLSEQRPQHAIETDAATVLLSLGHAAAHAPPASISQRAAPLLGTFIASAKSARGEALRSCAARAFELLAKVLCSLAGNSNNNNSGGAGFHFGSPAAATRDEAVELLLKFLSASLRGAYDHAAQLVAARRLQLPALHACALLVSLQPRAPARISAAMVQSLLQLMQADVLAARAEGGAVGSHPADLQAVAEETFRHRQLMSVSHAVLASLLEMQGPPPSGLFPLLAAVLPLGLSSYALLRFRAMEAAARLLQRQQAAISKGGPLPEASLDSLDSTSGGGKNLSVLAAWHAFAAGRVSDALGVSSSPARSSPPADFAPSGDASDDIGAAAGGVPASPVDPFSTAIGACLGLVLPRCSDPEGRIRRAACSAAQALLQLAVEARSRGDGGLGIEGTVATPKGTAVLESELVEANRVLARCADASELEQRVDAQRALVSSLLNLLLPAGIDALTRSLIGGLDAEWSGAAAACVALDGLLPHANVSGSTDFVRSVLNSLLDVLPRIESQLVRNGALTVGVSLATADLDALMRTLLAQPVPLGSSAVGLVQRLAREPAIFERLLRALTAAVVDEEAADAAARASDAAARAHAATALLSAIAEEDPELLEAHRSTMMAAIILRMGSVRGTGGRPEATTCRAALAMLEANPDVPLECAEDVSDAPASPDTDTGADATRDGDENTAGEDTPLTSVALVAALRAGRLDSVLYARSLARLTFSPPAMRRGEAHALFERLHPHTTARSESVREVVLATVSELAIACRVDAAFTNQTLHLLLRGLVDDAPAVRVQALLGLRHLGATSALKSHVGAAHFETALSSIAATLADSNVSVGLAAFAALVPALASAHPGAVAALLPQLSEHSRSASELDESSPRLRAAGFETFAWLSRAAAEPDQSPEARAAFAEHAHALLPLLLLHAQHEDSILRRASLAAIRALEPWFSLGESVLPAGAPGSQPHAASGDEWLSAVAATLVRAQPARLARYTSCVAKRAAGAAADAHVRSKAALFVGALLSLTSEWEVGEDDGEVRAHAVQQLVLALSDSEVSVRREAARALGGVGRSASPTRA